MRSWCVANRQSEVLQVFLRRRSFVSALPFTGFMCQASSMLWWIEPRVSEYAMITGFFSSNPHARVCTEDLSVWLNGLHWHPSHALLSSLLPPSSWQIDPLEMDADMHSLEGTNWLLDQRDSSRRPVSTKYETTIFWGRIPSAHPLPSCPLSPPSTSSLHPCIQFCIHLHTYMQARCLLTVMVKHPSGLPTPAPSSDLPSDPCQPLFPPWHTFQWLSLIASLACCLCGQWWSLGTDDTPPPPTDVVLQWPCSLNQTASPSSSSSSWWFTSASKFIFIRRLHLFFLFLSWHVKIIWFNFPNGATLVRKKTF